MENLSLKMKENVDISLKLLKLSYRILYFLLNWEKWYFIRYTWSDVLHTLPVFETNALKMY